MVDQIKGRRELDSSFEKIIQELKTVDESIVIQSIQLLLSWVNFEHFKSRWKLNINLKFLLSIFYCIVPMLYGDICNLPYIARVLV